LRAFLLASPVRLVALFGEAETLLVAVLVPEAGQLPANLPQPVPTVVHVTDAVEKVEGSGQFRGDDDAELFAGLANISNGVQFGDVLEHRPKLIAPVFVPEPLFVAAVAPLEKIAFIDGTAAEFFGEYLAALGQLVDPVKNFRAGMAVAEAAVQLLPEVVWQAGDFSYAAHGCSFSEESGTGGGTKTVQGLKSNVQSLACRSRRSTTNLVSKKIFGIEQEITEATERQ